MNKEEKITMFIDTQDMEERYGEELYKEYLERENKQLKERIYKARKMIFDNYGLLDKYEIEMLDDILKGDINEKK